MWNLRRYKYNAGHYDAVFMMHPNSLGDENLDMILFVCSNSYKHFLLKSVPKTWQKLFSNMVATCLRQVFSYTHFDDVLIFQGDRFENVRRAS